MKYERGSPTRSVVCMLKCKKGHQLLYLIVSIMSYKMTYPFVNPKVTFSDSKRPMSL